MREADETASSYWCFSLQNSTSVWDWLQGFHLHSRPSLIPKSHKTGETLFNNKERNLLDQHAHLQHILKSTEPGTLSCLLCQMAVSVNTGTDKGSPSRQKCLASSQLPQRGVSGIVQTLATTGLCEPLSGCQLSFHWSDAALITSLHSFVTVFFFKEAFFFNSNVQS